MTQRQRVRAGQVVPASVAVLRPRWTLCLRLLAAEAAAADAADLEQVAGVGNLAQLLETARDIRDGGYRGILSIPDA